MRQVSLLLALVVLLVAGTAFADIDPTPIKARLERPARLAAVGRELTTMITIEAAVDANLRGLRLAGDGWSIGRWDGLRDLTLSAGRNIQFALGATPRAGFGPLVLSAEVNGRPWQRKFDLSPAAYGGILPTDSDLLPPQRFLPSVQDKSSLLPQLAAAELTALATAEPAEATPLDKSRLTCTVTGTIIYFNDGNQTWLPATGASVWIYVRGAGGGLYAVGTQPVDGQGDFSIEITDDTDFWVGYSASSHAVVVQDPGIWEEDYVWISTKFHTPDGASTYHVGLNSPASHPGALHICVDVTYAHDNFRDVGWDVPAVDVQWPIDDGSVYNPDFDEMHIEREAAWNDGTICHEWGHYFNDLRGHDISVDYCNGICDADPPDDCGHCGWCPESEEVTWLEGVAQFLSRINTDYIEKQQEFFAPVHKGVDSYYDDPNCDWDPWYIEFVFGGAVWDLVDDDHGTEINAPYNDALGRPLYDQLDLDVADILSILCEDCDTEGHQPYRQAGFYRCAYEYIREQADPDATPAKLWETLMSWGLNTDVEVPAPVATITSSLPAGQPTYISLAHFGWTEPDDDAAGVCAYSITLNQGSMLPPDEQPDVTVNYYNSPQMSPGNWYFGIRAADRSGRWSTPTYYGPIIITAPGASDLAFETPSGWAAPLVARSTTVGSPPAPVAQPNYVQGNNVYFNWAGRNVGAGPSGNVRDHVYLDGTQVYTGSIYYVAPDVGFQHRDKGPVNTGKYGRHTVWVKLDGSDAAAEADEENNFYAKQFVFSPVDLNLDEIVLSTTGLPEPTSGEDLLPPGTPFYPNCLGLDVELCIYPELVWMAPNDPDNRLVARMHPRDVGQTGFAAPLMESTSSGDTPAAVIQNPSETILTSYCVGLAKGQPSGPVSDGGYRYSRELGQMFAMPDTIAGNIDGEDCLDFYYAYNDLDEEAWFTIKLANHNTPELEMRLFEPGFAMGDLFDADVTVHIAQGDTSYYNVLLPPGEITIAVVSRDFRLEGSSLYTIFAYNAKPDPAASTPAGWFANVVPQIGTPYYADSDDIPAPTALTGGSAATGIYWSLKNESPDAGIPIGLRHEVDLDGTYLFSSIFIEPLLPDQEVKAVQSSLYNVRGGRHTLTHRVNSNYGIDEDNWANNRHGRQWVWSSQSLAANTVFTLPAPPSPYGGLSLVTEGTVALNCDGYHPTTPISPLYGTIVAAYAIDDDLDVDLGAFAGTSVLEGFTEDLIMSQWSGAGCDFVLRYVPAGARVSFNLGVIRAGGPQVGDYTLATKTTTDVWQNPVDDYERGTVEAGTYLDALRLDLPAGIYRFTLRSRDVDLGLSLHDLSAGVAAKTEPWQAGIVWQTAQTSDDDVSFVISVPAQGAPSEFALVVWRTEDPAAALDGAWQVTIGSDITDVAGGDLPLPAVSRLVSASPNPFNPMTEINFELAASGRCDLTVHDARGRLVRTLVAGDLPAGRRSERWDGRDDSGQRMSSGVYLARLRTPDGASDLLKLTLVK